MEPRLRPRLVLHKEALVPKLIIEFASSQVFVWAVNRNGSVKEMEAALADIVADETAHMKGSNHIRFNPDRQVDIVLYVAAETHLNLGYMSKMCLRSASVALCTLESYDFGDMVARKTRIGARVKKLLGIPDSENIQMALNLLPEGHWERI